MKKVFVAFTIIMAISFVFISCEGANEAPTNIDTPIIKTPPPLEITEEERTEKQVFEFWAKKVEVEPMVINENDTWGEEQQPAVSMRFVFYFTDSAGNERPLIVDEWYQKVKPADNSEELSYYKRNLDDFNKSKALYEKITKMPEGSIYVSGVGKYIKALQKKSDPVIQKVGTAIVKKEPMEDIWRSSY